jgi:subtilisin family serine protease
MKKVVFLLFFHGLIFSQSSQSQMDQMNFEPGEIIVKLKDNINTNINYKNDGKAESNFNIAQLLGIEDKVATSSIMFHQKTIEASILNKQKMKKVYASKGASNPNRNYETQEPLSMKNVFVLKTRNIQENISELLEQIKYNPNVDYAEPNYRFSIDDFKVGNVITAEEVAKLSATTLLPPLTPNDPLFSAQSNIIATNIDDVWGQYTTGNGTQIIAILDTGVDYTHPDLAANIWSNSPEANGVPGYDDDRNGFIDDVKGWDFINLDNAPLDDNMHGTHVAGIAGAVGNNGIGISGAAWNVKLMPIKVFQSTGQGNSSTIASGVEYAVNNGATILNMSFGSFGESLTLKTVLENAYATAILVAGAGNNKTCIGPGLCPDRVPGKPFFPGAYSFVLGIEDGSSDYDNYDQDGPVFSEYPNLLNYELRAPGTNIMSTVPNGGYALLTGTSMATPLVSGALALYKQVKPTESRELMFGNLINSSGNVHVDFLDALQVVPTPKLSVLSASSRDTINNQNGNGLFQPGETIEILPLIKNYWGPTTDVRVGISFAPLEDQTKATIVQNEIQIGSISAYATLQNLQQSLKITIANNVANNVNIKFQLRVWSGPNQNHISAPVDFVINVKNSILLSGLISTNLTLSPNNEYLISDNVVVIGNAIVTILPGTILKISDNKGISFIENSKLICNGTKENKIKIIKENLWHKGFTLNSVSDVVGWHSIKFTEFSGISNQSIFPTSKSFLFEDSLIYDCNFSSQAINIHNENVIMRRINIINTICNSIFTANETINVRTNQTTFLQNHSNANINISDMPFDYSSSNQNFWYQRIYDINYINNHCTSASLRHLYLDTYPNTTNNYIYNNWNAFGNTSQGSKVSIAGSFNSTNFIVKPRLYLGSSSPTIIDNNTWHFLNNGGPIGTSLVSQPIFNFSSAVTVPYPQAHGIVWKILVNNKDAQDEYNVMDPIGVGSHQFKVYFNRAMDRTVIPQISYGVIEPFTQKIITEIGTWSTDGKIYTVNHTVGIGAADGINRIRVEGAKDLDNFYIPIENSRFNMLVQSAGSASSGFIATPGLGRIKLDWAAPSSSVLNDALGYNMYRYTANSNGTFTSPVKINSTLIVEDTNPNTTGISYTDFNVVEGRTYYYKYKILRTSFEETDYSQTISAAPLTSLLGDSNGDFNVNVMDLVHDVDYILGNNPTPFIFLAADINADQTINVLDIVGTVDIINVPPPPGGPDNYETSSNDMNFYPNNPIGHATFSWEGNDLYVESEHNIGGLQLAFNTNFEYLISPELSTIERLDYIQDNNKIVMLYSFNNTSITNGKTKILTRLNALQELNIEKAVVGTTVGKKLTAVYKNNNLNDIVAPMQSDSLKFINMVPNPTDDLVTIDYFLPEDMDGATACVYDFIGRLVFKQEINKTKGLSQTQLGLGKLSPANYIVLITAEKNGGIKHIANKKLIIK